ncbi:MAG TPA: murein L,D-transpeptidase catalytic domain family protein [Luteimonas sp.]|nr:murein L,D-transpeptidase catalytic domain family protein [Luteimonas sp.]
MLAGAVQAQAQPGRAAEAGRSTRNALLAHLRAAAPQIDRDVLALALEARSCAVRTRRADTSDVFTVIDYRLPSTEKRMWVFDLRKQTLLYAEHVAHGQNSGGNRPHAFSNREGSYQSSLGLFETAESYVGANGYSLRLDGLEPGVNDAARARAIVMHGAWYVDPLKALRQGRLGRSQGCPALRPAVARPVIDTIKGGQLLFAYYPDSGWLKRSRFLGCDGRGKAG